MTLEEAEAITMAIDLDSHDRFTPKEVAAVGVVMSAYMMGYIDRERCASALQRGPADLPPPWRGNA